MHFTTTTITVTLTRRNLKGPEPSVKERTASAPPLKKREDDREKGRRAIENKAGRSDTHSKGSFSSTSERSIVHRPPPKKLVRFDSSTNKQPTPPPKRTVSPEQRQREQGGQKAVQHSSDRIYISSRRYRRML